MSEKVLSTSGEALIRQIKPEDIDQIVELALMGFGEEIAFEAKHYREQLRKFPEGQICYEYQGKVVGSSSSLLLNFFEEYDLQHSFAEICDQGYIGNHHPQGVNLYGIEIVVHPDFRHKKIAQKLYDARRELCRKLNLKSIIVGGRIPFYHKYADQLTAHEFVQQVIEGKLYDPVCTFQKNNGFILLDVISNYLPPDKESCQYASLMEWVNPDYRENG